MLDNINFVDLVALTRITPESTVEKFGGLINSSFFDASNILGTLKQKGLVDFVTSFPSQSAITVTEQGKSLIDETKQKSEAPLDTLDMTVLLQLSNGKHNLADLNGAVNITPKDLAIRLYKLSLQQFVSYELRNGNMDISMTEKGFLKVKEGINAPVGSIGQAAAAQQTVPQDPAAASATAQKPPQDINQIQAKIMRTKRTKCILVFAIMLIAVLVILYLSFGLHLFSI